jgi:hypothetical protein
MLPGLRRITLAVAAGAGKLAKHRGNLSLRGAAASGYTGGESSGRMSQAVRGRHKWLRLMLGDAHLRACAVFTLVMLLMPPEGLGIDLCFSQLYFHAPCPACGVTRGGSNLMRGNFTRAAQFHPFVPVIVPLIVALGVLAILPRRWREAVRAHVMRRALLLKPLYWLGIYSFAIYGAVRWGAVFLGWYAFPATWP